jgi:hypothetical protein
MPRGGLDKRNECETNLFVGYAIYATKNVKPPPKELKPIVQLGGGTFCTLAQMKRDKGNIKICLTCEQDLAGLEKDTSIFDGICTNEFVLDGLIKQQLDEKKHSMKGISAGADGGSKSTSSTKKRKVGATATATKAASTRTSKRARRK